MTDDEPDILGFGDMREPRRVSPAARRRVRSVALSLAAAGGLAVAGLALSSPAGAHAQPTPPSPAHAGVLYQDLVANQTAANQSDTLTACNHHHR